MGYRNKVAVIMKKNDYKNFIEEIKNDKEYQEIKKEEYTNFDFYTSKTYIKKYDAILIQWDWVKWDEATDFGVEKFVNYLKYMKAINRPFHYIRIGEGNGVDTDIEDYYCLGSSEGDEWVENLNGMYNVINWNINITIDF